MPCILNRTCIILGCASCHVYVMVVYRVVCFFPVLLLQVGSDKVAFVRIRSTSSVCLLHGLVLLPCGISVAGAVDTSADDATEIKGSSMKIVFVVLFRFLSINSGAQLGRSGIKH
ncbi:hypothetical protein VPH35_123351 [Triticum aestivum]